MLNMILNTVATNNTKATGVTPQVKVLLKTLVGTMNRDELQAALKLKDRKSFRERYLKPVIEAGLIEMTLPTKPNSRMQSYRLKK
jgi:hypothetical protein